MGILPAPHASRRNLTCIRQAVGHVPSESLSSNNGADQRQGPSEIELLFEQQVLFLLVKGQGELLDVTFIV
jgi:hypothetical protein